MFENRYSFMDRTVHRIAFHTNTAQISLSDWEDRKFAKQLKGCTAKRPVFITALPRAGTTLLLECVADHPEFASHTYRDMPFVMIPLYWNQMSARFQQKNAAVERAHGDGMVTNADSPEALEEVLWKVFWKKHYRGKRITPWGVGKYKEFREFFKNHMRKVIFLRRGEQCEQVRYVSKNNANIARIRLLRKMFPECSIVVPFRDPVQHAQSLLKQQKNFLEIQREDPFALEYMTAIGHHDFGKKLYPIDFDGWLEQASTRDATTLTFWLEYWVAAYRHVLVQREADISLVAYESLCGEPKATMKKLVEVFDIDDPAPLLAHAEGIHSPAQRAPDCSDVPDTLLSEATALYARLLEAAV